MPIRHGTRTCYNGGCRCDDCKMAARNYDKARRQKMLAAKHGGGTVTQLQKPAAVPDLVPAEAGPVESAVIAEIGGLSTAQNRPGLVEVARALAKVLDSPLAIAQHASAGHRLSETLDKLRKGADGKAGKLAAVRSMTRKATG